MNGWTFLLSCLMTGGSLLTMAGIWKDNIGHFYIPVLMAAAGIVCSMLAYRLKDKYQLSVLILLAPWPAAFVLTGFRGCFEGLKAWINLMITQWNKVHEDSIALLSGNIVQHDLWASTVVIALLCGEVTYFLITLRKYGFCALYCILWVMVQLFSSAFSPAACIGLFVPVVAVYISNQRTEMTHRGLLWVAGLTAVLVICAVAVPQEDMLSMAKAKSALKLSLSNMRYGQPTLPEGHVDEADRLKANENEMFTVTSEQKKNLYLKGYSGGRYIDGCWKPLSNADYSGEYSGMLKWLAKLNFHPLTQAAEYYALSDAEQEDIPETNELQTNDGIYSAVCQIRNKLEGTVFYTYEPKKPPQGEDPILWFLTQSHEGNAVLYASAAVEALRTHGVPARYAEGYYVLNTDFQKSEDSSAAVTRLNAHAWVEIYFDGIGWLPVEVTPGYYYDTVTLRKLISTSNVIRKTAAVEDNPNRADPLLTAGGQGDGQSSKAVEVVKDVEAIVLGIVVIFILLVIFLIIALELHRIVIIRRKGKYLKNASQEERVIEIEKRIFLMMNFRGIEARLGWKTEKTDQCLAERFEWAQSGDYARVCSILEKAVYGGCELEAYEMRTLYYFLEKISAADTTDDWKIRIKMRYAC